MCVWGNLVEGEIFWFMTFISLRWHLLLMFVICLILSVTYYLSSLQVLWFFLSHFCGPVGGARKLCCILRHWEPGEAVSGLLVCCLSVVIWGAPLRPYLTWEASSQIPNLLIIIVCSLHLPVGTLANWIASFWLSALLQPVEIPASLVGNFPSPQASFPIDGIYFGLWCPYTQSSGSFQNLFWNIKSWESFSSFPALSSSSVLLFSLHFLCS